MINMEQKQITATYAEAVKAIKEAILESRYRAARLVNKEVLALYYAIGGYISVQSRAARWGSNAIGTISELLQQELPGLRGFSETSIKRMRIFYEECFGPIIHITKANDAEDALRLCNDNAYGLSSALLTNDISTALTEDSSSAAELVSICSILMPATTSVWPTSDKTTSTTPMAGASR